MSLINSRSWPWTVKSGVLQSMGPQSHTRLSDWTKLMKGSPQLTTKSYKTWRRADLWEYAGRRSSSQGRSSATSHVTLNKVLQWPLHLFRFSHKMVGNTRMHVLTNPILFFFFGLHFPIYRLGINLSHLLNQVALGPNVPKWIPKWQSATRVRCSLLT